MSIKTSSDEYTFVIVFESEGDLPDDEGVTEYVQRVLEEEVKRNDTALIPLAVVLTGKESDE
jgi:hypothetical protein